MLFETVPIRTILRCLFGGIRSIERAADYVAVVTKLELHRRLEFDILANSNMRLRYDYTPFSENFRWVFRFAVTGVGNRSESDIRKQELALVYGICWSQLVSERIHENLSVGSRFEKAGLQRVRITGNRSCSQCCLIDCQSGTKFSARRRAVSWSPA